jgi:DNA invertase Pin-like site-specific DNA recombinase
MKIVSYLRVSTAKQGQSGLGLEAQKTAIEAYVASKQAEVLASFTEIESGKNSERPKLVEALHLAKVTGAMLVIAKLDRLSRDVEFLYRLMNSGVQFICADMPDANEMTVGFMAVVAQQERKAISKRTKDALAEAKKRGQKLGNPNGASALRRANKGNSASLIAIKANADKHASFLQEVIESLASEGIVSLGALAIALNERSMKTVRGGAWHKTSVSNLVKRIATL